MDAKVLSRLQALCSRREYCCKDIYDKALKALDGDSDAASEMLASLKADRFVDDARYAAAFARDKSSLSGWGPVKIRFALSRKGIDASTVAGALSEIDADKASDKLTALIQAKYRTLKGEPDAKLKLLRFALGRGYDYDAVKPVVESVLKG